MYKKLKIILTIVTLVFSFSKGFSQNANSISAGFGFIVASPEDFNSLGLSEYVETKIVYKVGFARYLDSVTRIRVDYASSFLTVDDLQILGKGDEISWNGQSINIGPQFRFLKLKRFHFLSGFMVGYNFYKAVNKKENLTYKGGDFDYALNPLSISVLLNKKGTFLFDVDTFMGTAMHTNIYVGLSYVF